MAFQSLAGKYSGQWIEFGTIVHGYNMMQTKVLSQVNKVASLVSKASPGAFLLLQFSMGQVTQIGDSISNLISLVQGMMNMAVRNQKAQ
ncbi:MAG: hypothetical protein A2Y28_00435 [Chlamydiae bacterium GWC2_50_10]|nr:MAG: hypothetical protein A2Z85_04880 [Chlamydiae bacterium GWA2_50_15]OGN53591.1 MAG: hypothetical protein A2Y28_00435 [Chlamydiae bacterium GWC2_50_10]OGN64281.1 MAG: hypothetical protein A3E26_03995 [Chlamydiae bacterium RIFCSPHIGHO2_12_FULL_49_32]OGN67450.1 MAG: hypothetical protein A3I15_01905 [Chlamydiae bacterium RIFCSPLOWO2_02_FULL_49_12]OGN72306.1 MAG: hypothetical protein A3G30_04300 [Chlamydiae bacterium RIFCSPLOWO2_12_FULL_49_12]HCJ83213.1 hypothetical protein [Parachlamydiales 